MRKSMIMLSIAAILLTVMVFTENLASHWHKCCPFQTCLNKTDSKTFECVKDTRRRRLEILKSGSKVIGANFSGTCVDVEGDELKRYHLMEDAIIKEEELDYNYFPKCCPADCYYNSVKHSCEQSSNSSIDYITKKAIKVGLPQCRIVVDHLVASFEDITISFDSLHLTGSGASFAAGHYCVDRNERSHWVVRGCRADLAVCKSVRCVHKCCPDGQSFVNGSACRDTYGHGLDLAFSNRINRPEDPFAIIHRYECRIYILDPNRIAFYVDSSGTFWAYYNLSSTFVPYNVSAKSYCIEHVKKAHLDHFEFFMCYPDAPIQLKFWVSRWAKIASCVFLFATILVYLCLPEINNFFGKILLSYCAVMLVGFLLLTYSQFELHPNDRSCVVIGFLSMFTFLCSFTWLNVICLDIWWTLGCSKPLMSTQQKRREIKRFMRYSLYGWGAPLIFTLIVFIIYKSPNIPTAIRPFLGQYKCYIEKRAKNYAKHIYFIVPVAIIEVINSILFVKTVIYCLNVKDEINRMNSTHMSKKQRRTNYNADKERLALLIKLSVIMGISFIFEVVSSLVDFHSNSVAKYVEVVWDTINCSQGVFIFAVFVCKAKVWRLLKGKFVNDGPTKILRPSTNTAHTSLNPKVKEGAV